MRGAKRKTFFCVHGNTPEEFQENMNAILADVHDPEVTFPDIPLTAYVMAVVWERVPESLSDLYSLRGETYKCTSCPYFERTNDLRRRWHYCRFHDQSVRDDKSCCEDFYQQLDRGTIDRQRLGRKEEEY